MKARSDVVLSNSTRLDLPLIAAAWNVREGVLFGLEDGMFARMLLEANPSLYLVIADGYSSRYRKTKKLGAVLSLEQFKDRYTLTDKYWQTLVKQRIDANGHKLDMACFDQGNPLKVRGWTSLMEPLSLAMGYSFYDRQRVREDGNRQYLLAVQRWADRHKTRLYLTGEHWPGWWATLKVSA